MNSFATFVALLIAVFMATFVPSAAAFDAGDAIMLIVGLIALFVVIFAILGCISRRGQTSA
jgi:uncharacterized membrane protein